MCFFFVCFLKGGEQGRKKVQVNLGGIEYNGI